MFHRYKKYIIDIIVHFKKHLKFKLLVSDMRAL